MAERFKTIILTTAAAAVLGLMSGSETASAGEIIVHVGPPSVGQGGSNPLSVPPINPIEYEFEWISPKGFEANIGITPGLLFGIRSQTGGGFYVGAGGGLVISANGVGPGAYSSFGINVGKKVFFNAELKQALGIALQSNSIISPYALRVGMGFRW